MSRSLAVLAACLFAPLSALGVQPGGEHVMITRGGQPGDHAPNHDRQPEQGMESAQPGEIHKRLMALAGEYDVAVTMSMGGQELKTTLKSTISPMLEGRFLRFVEKGELMGQPFSAEKVMGYNADSKQYEGVWMYTGSTAMMRLSGMGDMGNEDLGGESGITMAAMVDSPGGAQAYMVTMRVTGPSTFEVKLASMDENGNDAGHMLSRYTRAGATSAAGSTRGGGESGGIAGKIEGTSAAIAGGSDKDVVGAWEIDVEASRPLLTSSIKEAMSAAGMPTDADTVLKTVNQRLDQLKDANITIDVKGDHTFTARAGDDQLDAGKWSRSGTSVKFTSNDEDGQDITATLKDGKMMVEESGIKFVMKRK